MYTQTLARRYRHGLDRLEAGFRSFLTTERQRIAQAERRSLSSSSRSPQGVKRNVNKMRKHGLSKEKGNKENEDGERGRAFVRQKHLKESKSAKTGSRTGPEESTHFFPPDLQTDAVRKKVAPQKRGHKEMRSGHGAKMRDGGGRGGGSSGDEARGSDRLSSRSTSRSTSPEGSHRDPELQLSGGAVPPKNLPSEVRRRGVEDKENRVRESRPKDRPNCTAVLSSTPHSERGEGGGEEGGGRVRKRGASRSGVAPCAC